MVELSLKTTDNGFTVDNDGNLIDVPKTRNKFVCLYYVLKDTKSIKRYVADMLKFEGETPGESLLEKECFTNSSLIEDALEILVGMRIYVAVTSTKKDDGTVSIWKNLTSWKRAGMLGLPM